MCIPCVMCGACMGLGDDEGELMAETVCPECGKAFNATDVTCPSCYTFLAKNAMLNKQRENARAAAPSAERIRTRRHHPNEGAAPR